MLGRAGVLLRVPVAGLALAAVILSGAGSSASGEVSAACGSSTLATVSTVAATVATNLYQGELGDAETQADLGHVTGAGDLVTAVAADDRPAAIAAAKRIVYHHFWHIVRLRVLDAGGRVLADIGGPYVIAPVSGQLQARGTLVGSFVMSVQDDLGFAKLERRFVGDRVAIYVNGRRVVEWGGRFPHRVPGGGSVRVGGVVYAAVMEAYNAFPSGMLRAVIAVPAPPAALTREPCSAVVVGEIGRVAERIAALFHPLASDYAGFIGTTYAYTGAIAVVRVGADRIGGVQGLGPATLPQSGTVSYLGQSWSVFSFVATPPARIYVLVPQT